jgi:NitT/TauT family transport system substrate-binding protein
LRLSTGRGDGQREQFEDRNVWVPRGENSTDEILLAKPSEIVVVGVGSSNNIRSIVAQPIVVRVGHFPNITHAQGLIGHHLSRQGKDGSRNDWARTWSSSVRFQRRAESMEGILTGSIDITYVGRTRHQRTPSQQCQRDSVVAGACSGGAALVVQPDGRIRTDADLKGKRIATPQLGNTQDVAARAYLVSKGYRVTLTGGDAKCYRRRIPTS